MYSADTVVTVENEIEPIFLVPAEHKESFAPAGSADENLGLYNTARSPSMPSSPTRTKRKREPEDSDLKDLSVDEEEEITSAKEEEEEKPEVEVLSHAAQRKRRKQLAAAGATGEDVPPAKSSTQSSRQATDALAKRQHSVWVGNLSFKTDPKALRQFFSEVGENCVTRVHMPMKLPSGPQDGVPGAKARLDNRGSVAINALASGG